MGGIAGLWLDQQENRDNLRADITRMTDALRHRGPDGGDIWLDAGDGPALGHRRLAIVDPDGPANQPMVSADGRYVMVYNGEVYNAEDLRAKLSGNGIAWRGRSDSEVVLECIARWGVRDAVPRFMGMFAIALWDRRKSRLVLVRDRLGAKPLYWARYDGHIAFASELKALVAGNTIPREVNQTALSAYLRFGHVPSGHSIYAHAKMLPPGHILEIAAEGHATEYVYWSVEDAVLAGQNHGWSGDDASAIDALHDLLRDAVGRRMTAGVPVGAFLTGGVNSALITALMQEQASQPVSTFSIGFEHAGAAAQQGAATARDVAAHLGTRHSALVAADRDVAALVPQLSSIHDEPFCDISAIPASLLARMAAGQVGVALTGDGGVELFGGHGRYGLARRLAMVAHCIPMGAGLLAGLLHMLPASLWGGVARLWPGDRARMNGMGLCETGAHLRAMMPLLGIDDDLERYVAQISIWDPARLLRAGASRQMASATQGRAGAQGDHPRRAARPFRMPGEKFARNRGLDQLSAMQVMDMMLHLVDDVLARADRTSMASALEIRMPMIDHRVVELGWRLPARLKFDGHRGQVALRRILARHVPETLVAQSQGWANPGVPLAMWLRGMLRDWAGDTLGRAAFYDDLGLDRRPIDKCLNDHLAGRRDASRQIWAIAMLADWHHRWQDNGSR